MISRGKYKQQLKFALEVIVKSEKIIRIKIKKFRKTMFAFLLFNEEARK